MDCVEAGPRTNLLWASLLRPASRPRCPSAAIPNPNYVAYSDIPRYAAIRFCNCVPENEAQKLLGQVKELKDAKMPFKPTAAHGDIFYP
ncbi:hypothetical protein EJ02DRAFT_429216 [Clathrospora elynae]|uniref:Uncharacterized protein n=1 Tax=Clathrospora elynae TaxID=706981 RepID=A0A6A5SAS9_9PLEO|nr:hypothetical protein EJ02DRAFT_429218 [Clathrospora elynae]KAF1934587.1 hypothetical protein EJ02DRAFT_429216 [Clathrospora elynae]